MPNSNSRTSEPCGHPIKYGGLCAVCGEIIRESLGTEEYSHVGMASSDQALTLTDTATAKLEDRKLREFLHNRKMILVLDLDHTLIHGVMYVEPGWFSHVVKGGAWGTEAERIDGALDSEDPDVRYTIVEDNPGVTPQFYLVAGKADAVYPEGLLLNNPKSVLPHLGRQGETSRFPQYVEWSDEVEEKLRLWERSSIFVSHLKDCDSDHAGVSMQYRCNMKLRPGVLRFLQRSAINFQLYIFTAGTTAHAIGGMMALDPENRFFRQRLFSRKHMTNQGFGAFNKSLESLFPSLHKLALVVDDTDIGVWDKSAALIKCYAYHWWPANVSLEAHLEMNADRMCPPIVLAKYRASQRSPGNFWGVKKSGMGGELGASDHPMFMEMARAHAAKKSGEDNLQKKFEEPRRNIICSENGAWDFDYCLASITRVLEEVIVNFYQQVEMLTCLGIDLDNLEISDLPSAKDVLNNTVMVETLGMNRRKRPSFVEAFNLTLDGRDIKFWATDYDYWINVCQLKLRGAHGHGVHPLITNTTDGEFVLGYSQEGASKFAAAMESPQRLPLDIDWLETLLFTWRWVDPWKWSAIGSMPGRRGFMDRRLNFGG